MSGLYAALWSEGLKVRRSRVPWLAGLGFTLAPLVGALFMVILEDPARARAWGIIGTKAQVLAGTADWPTYLSMLAQATAVGGALVFSVVTAWIFGREHADRTIKDLLALPTPRWSIVAAKMLVLAGCAAVMTTVVVALGLGLGRALDLPGGSAAVVGRGTAEIAWTALMTLALMPVVAFVAGVGRGYLLPLGWAILAVFLAQIAAATGWGAWFPWSVPALFAGTAGPRAELLGSYSYVLVGVTAFAGLFATFVWWLRADQPG